ncbi:hypothetical protein BGX31_000013 [Mortierella sp. GBA43]|nr:hypothetical protein BGX31_000013 [Mortierella sp. GBA43]
MTVQKTNKEIANHNYSKRAYKVEGYKSFEEFYPYYLSEHCNPINRRLHLFGYGLAWIGHFVFEKNKPATFKHPIYSFMGDWKMWFEVASGRRKF